MFKSRAFKEARKFARSLKFTRGIQWIEYCASGARPKDIPSNPNKAYPNEWINMADWLGTNMRIHLKRTKEMFIEQRAFVHSLKLKTIFEYRDWKKTPTGKSHRELPSNPDNTYRDLGWNGWGDWLGTGNIALFNREYLPFTEARAIVQAQGFKNTIELRKWKNRPVNIPSHPEVVYPDEFVSMSDWLGVSLRPTPNGSRPYIEARAFIHSLKFDNSTEFKAWASSDERPHDIPSAPWQVYPEWIGMADWLGKHTHMTVEFRDHDDALPYIHSLGFQNNKQYLAWAKTDAKPIDIPASPPMVYKKSGWKGWKNYLGTSIQYRDHDDALPYIHSLNLKTEPEYNAWANSDNRPIDIPRCPNHHYKNKGWKGWSNWLGTGKPPVVKYENCFPFLQAREIVRALKIETISQWKQWFYKEKPSNLPLCPDLAYKNKGWEGWSDWFGSDELNNYEKYRNRVGKIKEIVESLASCLPSLPTTAWWYILIQSGLDATAKEVKLLKKYQKGKLNLNELVDALISPDEIDEDSPKIDALEAYGKTDFIAKANEILNHPLIAGLDAEAIAAIVAELQATIWDQIFRASMTGDISEKEEIFKLKEILKRTHT